MPEIVVNLPSMLADCNNGSRRLIITAQTLDHALQHLQHNLPLLARHIFTEQGSVRPNVLIFLNDENIAWLERKNAIVFQPGDELHIVAAVSGGSGHDASADCSCPS